MFRKNSIKGRSDHYETVSFANAVQDVPHPVPSAHKDGRRRLHGSEGGAGAAPENYVADVMFDPNMEDDEVKTNSNDVVHRSKKPIRVARRKLASDDSEEDAESSSQEETEEATGKYGSTEDEAKPAIEKSDSEEGEGEGEESSSAEETETGEKFSVKATAVKVQKENGKDQKPADDEEEAGPSKAAEVKAPAAKGKAKTSQFEGVGATVDGEDIKRVSFMLMRLLKQYKAQSMVDVPCRAHGSWMHTFLDHVEKEIPDFQYYCVDTSTEILQAIKKRVGGKCRAKFVSRKFWSEKLPRADFVFSWSGLDKMQKQNVAAFFEKLNTSGRQKYVLIGSYMKGSKFQKKKKALLNVRTKPFKLRKPLRVVSKLSTEPVRKQLYIYKTGEMI